MPQKNMPKDWEPPYPSWSAQFEPDIKQVIVAYFAVQSKDGSMNGFNTWIQDALTLEDGPLHTERASYLDPQGYTNHVYICYWTDESPYRRWESSGVVSDWWRNDERLTESSGYWREVIFAPMSRLETAFSSEDSAGMASTASSFTAPVREHAYWGSMRDRIPDSENNDFKSTAGDSLKAFPSLESAGKRLRISPPENICLIRSAQNWTQCRGEELDIYQNDVHPVLIEGMNYIRDNPLDTGCITCRFMDELTEDGQKQSKTFGMAYFLTMAHLEQWAKSHPTHLAIFQSFHKMARTLEFQMDLKLWHEVIVLPGGSHIFEYINCHEKTGLLPYFGSG